jgi:hypothetical protein
VHSTYARTNFLTKRSFARLAADPAQEKTEWDA